MAWIESHVALRDHPKLYALMDRLSISKAEGIGHLHMLWWWAAEYASDGELGGHSTAQIARAADWALDADGFVAALVSAGFLDRGDAQLTIHDWAEFRLHFDASLERRERKREQVRERVKAFREREKAKRSSNAPVTQSNAANRKNLTETNNRTNTIVPGFESFWKAYPKHQARADALKAWKALNPDQTLQARILSALEGHKKGAGWAQEGGKFIPLPATWIRGSRWEDEVPTVGNSAIGGQRADKYVAAVHRA